MPRSARPTRERIVVAASKLFYAHGIGHVGIDAVATAAGVTKRTIYYHFTSKDDLVAAYLEERDQPNLALFKHWFDAAEGDTATRVEAMFLQLERNARHPKWNGCGFLRTSVELVRTPGHPAMKIGVAHKKSFEAWLKARLEEASILHAEQLARQIAILLEGSFAIGLLYRDPDYTATAGAAAATLIRAAPKRSSPSTSQKTAPMP